MSNKTRSLKSPLRLSALLLSSLVACAAPQSDVDGKFRPGTIRSGSSQAFDDAQLCDYETQCPAGTECIFIPAANTDSALCVDAGAACQALDCGTEDCMILESYPSQMMCGSSDPGPGDKDGDCAVDSDGNTWCPGGDDDAPPGTSPGNPGTGGGSDPGNPGGLDAGAPCDLNSPCASGTCAYIDGYEDGPICVDTETVCEEMGCEGQCLVQESYPVRIVCAE